MESGAEICDWNGGSSVARWHWVYLDQISAPYQRHLRWGGALEGSRWWPALHPDPTCGAHRVRGPHLLGISYTWILPKALLALAFTAALAMAHAVCWRSAPGSTAISTSALEGTKAACVPLAPLGTFNPGIRSMGCLSAMPVHPVKAHHIALPCWASPFPALPRFVWCC